MALISEAGRPADTRRRVRSAVKSSLRNIVRGLGEQAPARQGMDLETIARPLAQVRNVRAFEQWTRGWLPRHIGHHASMFGFAVRHALGFAIEQNVAVEKASSALSRRSATLLIGARRFVAVHPIRLAGSRAVPADAELGARGIPWSEWQ